MSNRSPTVSVIVPTFNRQRFLTSALESLREQTYQDFEVVVVNDAGGPAEGEVMAAGPRTKTHYLRLASNGDRSAARNHALRFSRGRYIAYLDDDDRFLPNHLEVLVETLRRGSRLVYSIARRCKQELVGENYVTTEQDIPYARDFDPVQLLLTNYIPILSVVHERTLLEEVGAFDEGLRVLEDWDLWIRMSRVTRFTHVPQVTCEFSSRTDGSSTTSLSAALFRKVEQELFLRYLPYISEFPAARQALHAYQHRYCESLVQAGDVEGAISLMKAIKLRDPLLGGGDQHIQQATSTLAPSAHA